jgi:transposase
MRGYFAGKQPKEGISYRGEWWVSTRSLRKQGMSYKDIGLALGIDWRTAKKLCEAEEPPRPKEREKSSMLEEARARHGS